MKPHILKTLVISAAMAVASIARADNWVHVNFGVTKIEAELVGPAGGAGETWNQAGTSTSDIDLTDSTGAATTIDWSVDGGLTTGNNWDSTNKLEMLESAFFRSDGGANTLTISGLDAGTKYDLYIASFDQNSWANTPMSFSTTNTTTTVGAQVALNTLGTPWTLDDNYVVFEGLEPDGSNNIAITGARTTGLYGFWSGFQLKGTPGPPSGTIITIK